MKKIIFSFVVVSLAFGILTGCSLIPKDESSAVVSSESESSVLSSETVVEATAEPTVTPAPTGIPEEVISFSEEEMLRHYESYKAFVDFWYQGGNENFAISDEQRDYEGIPYVKYVAEGIDSYEKLEEKALSLMSAPLFSVLQNQVSYIDIDGALWGPISYGLGASDGFAYDEKEYAKINDKRYELKITNYYYTSTFDPGADEDEVSLTSTITIQFSLLEGTWVVTKDGMTIIEPVKG